MRVIVSIVTLAIILNFTSSAGGVVYTIDGVCEFQNDVTATKLADDVRPFPVDSLIRVYVEGEVLKEVLVGPNGTYPIVLDVEPTDDVYLQLHLRTMESP